MDKRGAAALIAAGGLLLTGTAFAQSSPNPTQQLGATTQQGPTPLFRITVVGHTTPAINYRPRKGDTKVDFTGTALSPLATGNATVEGKKGYIDIDAKFDKLAPPTQFGPEYLTYVLWAVTPEGRSTNLGEVQVKDDEARIHVTTELQAFGMLVTAEPYFAVTQPSDVVVLENNVRKNTKGNVDVIQAKFDLLKRGTYLMNQDTRQLKLKPLEPGAPLIALQRQEEEAQAQQRAAAKQREDAALDRARSEESARKQAEIDRLTAEAARLSAERDSCLLY